MANPNELTQYGYNMSQVVDEPIGPSTLPPTQVNNAYLPPSGSRSMSIAALDAAIEHELRMGTLDPNMDKKYMRRIVSNRYAAKKSHDKKVNKVIELENNRKNLEDTISTIRPKIKHQQQFKEHLCLEKAMLVHRLQVTTDLKNLKDDEVYKNTMEREWLKGIVGMQAPPNYI